MFLILLLNKKNHKIYVKKWEKIRLQNSDSD